MLVTFSRDSAVITKVLGSQEDRQKHIVIKHNKPIILFINYLREPLYLSIFRLISPVKRRSFVPSRSIRSEKSGLIFKTLAS